MEEPKKPTIRRRKDDPPFRRKEDELRFNLFDRFLSLMKWLLFLVILILFSPLPIFGCFALILFKILFIFRSFNLESKRNAFKLI